MTKIRNLIILLITGMLLYAVPCSAAAYLDSIRESVCNIELGKYNEAAADAEAALALYDGDPLVYLAFGAIYLHTGRLDDAEQEFKKLLEIQPGDWRAEYGLGLLSLLRGKEAAASAHFNAAKKDPASAQDLSSLELYLNYINGRPCKKSMFEETTLPLGRETCALESMESGKKDAAIEIFKEVLCTPAPIGFDENRSPIATFNPKSPVALPGGRLTWKPAERPEVPSATGMVTLKADVSRANDVVYVSLYVDDQIVGVTNYEPYQFEWNTIRHPNGLHKIRIDGKNEAGSIVSSKTVWVKVKNANSPGYRPKTGPVAEELAERLWSCIRVSESRKFAYYELGRAYIAQGDLDKGMEQLEYAAAYDSRYMNVDAILSDLRKKRTDWQPVVKRGPSAGNKIALTFDDGPNERTREMLDVLDRLEVPATFFVVGFRAEAQPDLVREISSRGHQIENHSYTHPNLTSLPSEQVEAELSKNAAIIRAATGKPSLYFRPPGGNASKSTIEASTRLGLTGIFWTLLCSPYEGAKSQGLADYVIRNACDGAIVLMHNGEPGTTAALPQIVVELKARGYRFVTISELLTPEPPA